MDNKLSELKDVADYWRKVKSGELPAPGPNKISITACTLDADVSCIAALLAELEAKDERITTVTEEREFWRERVEGAEKEREEFRRRFNLERSYTEDADKSIAELEAKLATPVRLHKVTATLGHGDYFDGVDNGSISQREKDAEAIRAAGFKVDGDE